MAFCARRRKIASSPMAPRNDGEGYYQKNVVTGDKVADYSVIARRALARRGNLLSRGASLCPALALYPSPVIPAQAGIHWA
jgi:hypothetical protein